MHYTLGDAYDSGDFVDSRANIKSNRNSKMVKFKSTAWKAEDSRFYKGAKKTKYGPTIEVLALTCVQIMLITHADGENPAADISADDELKCSLLLSSCFDNSDVSAHSLSSSNKSFRVAVHAIHIIDILKDVFTCKPYIACFRWELQRTFGPLSETSDIYAVRSYLAKISTKTGIILFGQKCRTWLAVDYEDCFGFYHVLLHLQLWIGCFYHYHSMFNHSMFHHPVLIMCTGAATA